MILNIKIEIHICINRCIYAKIKMLECKWTHKKCQENNLYCYIYSNFGRGGTCSHVNSLTKSL